MTREQLLQEIENRMEVAGWEIERIENERDEDGDTADLSSQRYDDNDQWHYHDGYTDALLELKTLVEQLPETVTIPL